MGSIGVVEELDDLLFSRIHNGIRISNDLDNRRIGLIGCTLGIVGQRE